MILKFSDLLERQLFFSSSFIGSEELIIELKPAYVCCKSEVFTPQLISLLALVQLSCVDFIDFLLFYLVLQVLHFSSHLLNERFHLSIFGLKLKHAHFFQIELVFKAHAEIIAVHHRLLLLQPRLEWVLRRRKVMPFGH